MYSGEDAFLKHVLQIYCPLRDRKRTSLMILEQYKLIHKENQNLVAKVIT